MLLRSAAILAVLLLAAIPASCRLGPARTDNLAPRVAPALPPVWALLVGVETGGRRLRAEPVQACIRAGHAAARIDRRSAGAQQPQQRVNRPGTG
jgi:hypothetical protein